MRATYRIGFLWLALAAVVVLLLFVVVDNDADPPPVAFAEFIADVEEGGVASVQIDSNRLLVTRHDGATYTSAAAPDDALVEKLSRHGVLIKWAPAGADCGPWALLLPLLPLLAVVGLGAALLFRIARRQGGATGILALGRSPARRVEDGDARFADIGGLAAAKARLADLIACLRDPERWLAVGARLPRGVLLVGPPGCGKTLLARAVAGEASVPFFTLSASELVELFVGVGAARVRDLFAQAAKAAPAIVFIDELDAIGRRRGSGMGSAHDEREQTLNQLLASLDGFEASARVVVVAATNRADVLDPALLRPGRFDLRIPVDAPTEADRLEMLRIHTRTKKLAGDVSLDALARRTAGLSGADLENLANEAALHAVRRCEGAGDAAAVSIADFEFALRQAARDRDVFNSLDAVLIESASQVAQPRTPLRVRVELVGGEVREGELRWASSAFVKLELDAGGANANDATAPRQIALAKAQIRHLEPVGEADGIRPADLPGDHWARALPELAG